MRLRKPLKEAEYKDIFDKDVLDILDKRVKDPTKRSNPSQLLNNAFSNLRLIKGIEKDYKSSLEDLAVTLFKEAHPTLADMGITIDAKITDNTQIPDISDRYVDVEDSDQTEVEVDAGDVKMRRLINALTHGGAVRGSYSYNMIADELNIIDDRLIDSYNKVLDSTFGLYDFMKDMYTPQQLKSMSKGGGAVGSVKVIIPKELKDPSQIKIIARGQAFPYLVHELIKGGRELISKQQFAGKTAKQGVDILKKTSKIEYESEDLKFGKFIDEYIKDIVSGYINNADDFKTIMDFFLGSLYRLKSDVFIKYVSNCIRGKLTPQEEKWTKYTINDIVENNM
jgi:hypothetical protein